MVVLTPSRLPFLLLAALPLHAAEPLPVLHLRLDKSLAADDGVKPQSFRRMSVATRFDDTRGKLVDVPANQPRFERRAGKPWGAATGLLIEGPSENLFRNSSFEDGDAHWTIDDADPMPDTTEAAVHGEKGLAFPGRARLSQTIGALLDPSRADRKIFSTLSIHARRTKPGPPSQRIEQVVQPLAFTSQGGNRVHGARANPLGTTGWFRVSARFETTLPGEEWTCGFEIQEGGIEVDAAQLETSRTASTVSSFIPTGDQPARRALEDLVYPTAGCLSPEGGTLALWCYITNPFGEYLYLVAHGPFDRANRLRLANHGGVVGVSSCRWAENLKHGNWSHLAITWNGEEAAIYKDGGEAGITEGPFAYEQWTEAGPHWRLGGNGQEDMGAQGLLADLQVFDVPLTPAQVERLYETGHPGGVTGTAPAHEGLPVTFETPVAGATSLAVYDGDGVQHRELLIGEPLETGTHSITWDGRDRNGDLLPEGEYALRGVVADLNVHYEFSAGNSGDPPWDWERNIHAGLFIDVAADTNGAFYVASLTGEGNRHIQKIGPDGQVLWTSPVSPCQGPTTACALDERFLYLAVTIDSERESASRMIRPREAVWRIDKEAGTLAPWPDTGTTLPVNERRKPPASGYTAHQWGLEIHKVTSPQTGVMGLAADEGKLYVALRFEDAVAVYDRESGALLRRIENVASPRGLDVGTTGRLYVLSEGRLIGMDRTGEGRRTIADGLTDAWCVAVSPQDIVHVSEHGDRHQVRRFDLDGSELTPIGERRDAMAGGRVTPNRLSSPMGIAVDNESNIYVADIGHGRVQRYDHKGNGTLTVMAGGYGGNNGGVAVMPGEPERFFVSVGTPLGRGLRGRALTEYLLDYDKKTWELASVWPDITPIFAVEPLFIRKIEGRTYLFLLAKNIAVYELKGDRVEFCTALVCGSPHGVKQLRGEELRNDARELGLVDDKGFFKNTFSWTDANRDWRMQPGEIVQGAALNFYTVNDADVDANGNIVVHDHYTAVVARFPLLGFDTAGNPLYRWDGMKILWSLRETPVRVDASEVWAKELRMMGTRIDGGGNIYLTDVAGANWMDPEIASIRKLAPDGTVLFDVGRKARGLKDKPGEFQTIPSFCGLHKGLVFANEIESQVDVYTDDGLYVATLLENYKWGQPGPYVNWGENFFSIVFDHPETGNDYLIINPHFFHYPCYRIEGIDRIRRFESTVSLTTDWHARLAAAGAEIMNRDGEEESGEKAMAFVRLSKPPAIDGDIGEWQWLIPETAQIAEAEDQTGARLWAGYDMDTLYLACDVNDPTPAVNRAEAAALWSGDCLEAYLSTKPERFDARGELRAGNYIVHIACTESTALPRIEVFDRSAGRQWNPKGATLALAAREDRTGYRFEAAIPWEAIESGWRPAPDGRALWDWSISYSDPAGSTAAFKAFWTPETGGANWRTTASWDTAMFESFDRVIRRHESRIAVDGNGSEWPAADRPAIAVEEMGDRYAATFQWMYDEDHLYLLAEVRDPDPGLSEAAAANLIFSGDSITVHAGAHAETRSFVIIAHRGGKTAVYDPSTTARIPASKAAFRAGPDDQGYTLEASIPWTAIPGVEASSGAPLRLHWEIAWSDSLGGESAFERTWGADDETQRCFRLQ